MYVGAANGTLLTLGCPLYSSLFICDETIMLPSVTPILHCESVRGRATRSENPLDPTVRASIGILHNVFAIFWIAGERTSLKNHGSLQAVNHSRPPRLLFSSSSRKVVAIAIIERSYSNVPILLTCTVCLLLYHIKARFVRPEFTKEPGRDFTCCLNVHVDYCYLFWSHCLVSNLVLTFSSFLHKSVQ